MNWIIKFNQLEKESTDKILDVVAKFDKYKNDMLDEAYTKAYSLKHSINNLLDKLNAHKIVGDELKEEVERLLKTYIEMTDEYENAVSKIDEYIFVCAKEAGEIRYSMIEIVSRYLRTNKDAYVMEKRMDVFTKKLSDLSYIFEMATMDKTGIFHDVYLDLMTIKKIIETRNKEYDDEQYELMQQVKESQKKDYFKIFDYKEMISLAEENEYKQVRQSGDHIIMQHKTTNKIVPIPAHELKYGLMLQIQKQIHANKVS